MPCRRRYATGANYREEQLAGLPFVSQNESVKGEAL